MGALYFFCMRYHFEKPVLYRATYGQTYACDHPLYDSCTLYFIGNRGLAVIQQRVKGKHTYWSEIDPWLVDVIYLQDGFKQYFDTRSGAEHNGLYPTVTVRQIMWALKMKPLPKERWETVFDRKDI